MKYQGSKKETNYLLFNDEDVSIQNKYRFQIDNETDPDKPTGTDGPPINILQKKKQKRTELWQNRMLSVREWQNRIKGKGRYHPLNYQTPIVRRTCHTLLPSQA